MLVLERTLGEQIDIGPDVRLTVTRIREGRVWLGFDAPRHVTIHRHEVTEAIDRKRSQGRRRCR